MTEGTEQARGRFITVEGGEGVGKSSNMAFIADYLTRRGITVCRSREPGGTAFAESVRQLLVDRQSAPMPDEAELLLIFAARSSHIKEVIRPALMRGEWVLCDRFTDASYAYQGAARGLGDAPVAWLEEWIQGPLRPDLTLLLDAPVEVGFDRADRRGARDRFESQQRHFFEAVRRAYLARASAEPDRIRVIQADATLEQVQQDIQQVLDSQLKQWGYDEHA